MWPAQHITQSIARPPAEVVAFASDLSAWAAGVSDDMAVTFLPGREFGILDHDVSLPDGQTFHNPLRVLANGDGSEVVFTLYRREGVSDDEFAADEAAVAKDLATLKGLLEKVTIPVILDVDTGVDDALALLAAVRHPGVDLIAVSCVTGNASLERVVDNTLRVLDAAGAPADIPVAAGAVRPLLAPPRSAGHVHGEDGLAGIVLPESARVPDPAGAVAMLRRVILAHPEKVTIVALAPQTNLALLLRIHPEVADNIERIVFMGGSAAIGNATAVAEFNIWHDPEAAAAVIDSGVPCYMYGLDVFMQVAIDEAHANALAGHADAGVALAGQLLSHRISFSADEEAHYSGLIGDAGTVCALIDPEALSVENLPVRVELTGYGRGQTIVDRRARGGEDRVYGGVSGWVPMDVALDVDADRLAGVFLKAIGA